MLEGTSSSPVILFLSFLLRRIDVKNDLILFLYEFFFLKPRLPLRLLSLVIIEDRPSALRLLSLVSLLIPLRDKKNDRLDLPVFSDGSVAPTEFSTVVDVVLVLLRFRANEKRLLPKKRFEGRPLGSS